ncbi:MAG TPA: 4'-phosphopantetheinyl transferase superfamily protein [Beijerinckia sp.]|nr:4'-phosphopantetheinyl transferase superfamily protein [Beijerinckia sp.]
MHWTSDLESVPIVPLDGAVVLVLCLDDPNIVPFTRLLPGPLDLLRAEIYAGADKAYFLARRSVLRHLIGKWLGCQPETVMIAPDSEGAPLIMAPDVKSFISVTARGALAGFALASCRVGIDLEPPGAPQPPAWNILHPAERERLLPLDAASKHEAFLQCWTLKEAYLKALGVGLRREPSQIETLIADPGKCGLVDHDTQLSLDTCECRRLNIQGRKMAVACVVMPDRII